jgi:uncharacterized protein with HEPN domain
MQPEVQKYLHDLSAACDLIASFVADKILDDYRADAQLRSAVERQFIVVGEALQQAVRLDASIANTVIETRRIVNFRNVLVHGYAQVDHDTVWGVIEKDLPSLRRQVDSLLTG